MMMFHDDEWILAEFPSNTSGAAADEHTLDFVHVVICNIKDNMQLECHDTADSSHLPPS